MSSEWRVRIKVRNDRFRVKFQVDSDVVGQAWSYSVLDNGTEILSGTKVTHAPSGDFTVQRKVRGSAPGGHDVTATAENAESGETCEAAAAV